MLYKILKHYCYLFSAHQEDVHLPVGGPSRGHQGAGVTADQAQVPHDEALHRLYIFSRRYGN